METWDAFEGARDLKAIKERTFKGPATGPIYIEGARPGDALKVDFISIRPLKESVHMVNPGRGCLDEEFDQYRVTILPIEGDHLLFPGGIKLPLRPSPGLVPTTPTYVQHTASDSGPYGGDIDMQELVEGSTIYMPVFVEGGLLAMGDCHSVVGDGAVAGTGAETEAEIHIRVTLGKGLNLKAPRALTPEYFVTLSYGEELGPADETGGAGYGGLPGTGEGHEALRCLQPVESGRGHTDLPYIPAHQPREDVTLSQGVGTDRMRFGGLLLVALLVLTLAASCRGDEREEILVFVAASLTNVMERLGQQFTEKEKIKVNFNPGGSAALAQQIVRGAPADAFLSAGPEPMNMLEERGRLRPRHACGPAGQRACVGRLSQHRGGDGNLLRGGPVEQ